MKWIYAICLFVCFCCKPNACLAQTQPAPTRSQKIKSDIESILAQPEYSEKPIGEPLLAKLGRWISDKWKAFTKWFRRLFGVSGAPAGSSQVIVWVVLVAMAGVIVYVIVRGISRFRYKPRAKTKKLVVKGSLFDEIEVATDPNSLLSIADESAKMGDYRLAFRAVFLAILLRMDGIGWINYSRSNTNGEVLRALRNRPETFPWMFQLARRFDYLWYGNQATTAHDYELALERFHQLSGT